MNVDTFLEARELYDKYKLCETVLEYLSDEDKPQGQKFLETLKTFVNAFPNDFMMFVHQRMEAVGMEFEDLKCCDCDKQPEEPPMKFKEGDIVKILSGEATGKLAKVLFVYDNSYRVEFLDDGATGSLWYSESELDPYIEENGGADTPDEGE